MTRHFVLVQSKTLYPCHANWNRAALCNSKFRGTNSVVDAIYRLVYEVQTLTIALSELGHGIQPSPVAMQIRTLDSDVTIDVALVFNYRYRQMYSSQYIPSCEPYEYSRSMHRRSRSVAASSKQDTSSSTSLFHLCGDGNFLKQRASTQSSAPETLEMSPRFKVSHRHMPDWPTPP